MKVCVVDAITKDENGTVLINSNKCIGCKLCISACPFGNMSFNSEKKSLVKCDLCDGNPSCAAFCPSGAIEFREANPYELNKKRLVADKFKDLLAEVDE
jgi:Fe-S-cluster-containing dehydrogenase component